MLFYAKLCRQASIEGSTEKHYEGMPKGGSSMRSHKVLWPGKLSHTLCTEREEHLDRFPRLVDLFYQCLQRHFRCIRRYIKRSGEKQWRQSAKFTHQICLAQSSGSTESGSIDLRFQNPGRTYSRTESMLLEVGDSVIISLNSRRLADQCRERVSTTSDSAFSLIYMFDFKLPHIRRHCDLTVA